MKKILGLLMMLISLQMYGGTASVDAQEKKPDVAAANVEALAAFVVNRIDCESMEGMQCLVPVSTPEGGYCEVYYDQKNKL